MVFSVVFPKSHVRASANLARFSCSSAYGSDRSMSYGRPPPRIEGMVSLKVDNLTYRTTPEDLRRAFERCGEVGDVYIPRDRFTRESRGFAFVRLVFGGFLSFLGKVGLGCHLVFVVCLNGLRN